MRIPVAIAAIAGGLILVVPGSAGACSIRGTYCGYPSWAANAFEGPFGFRQPGQVDSRNFTRMSAGRSNLGGPRSMDSRKQWRKRR